MQSLKKIHAWAQMQDPLYMCFGWQKNCLNEISSFKYPLCRPEICQIFRSVVFLMSFIFVYMNYFYIHKIYVIFMKC